MTTLLELPDPIDLRAVSDKRTYTVDAKGNHLYGVYEHVRSRAWDEITAVCLHQTACYMGERPARYLSTGAHGVVTRNGQQIVLHDPTDRIVSANGFNARCLSLEFDGEYAGDDSTPARALATTWDDPTTKAREQPMFFTPESTAAGLDMCRRWIHEVAAHGGRIKFILAHRQSSDTRQNDPGAAPWRQVAIPLIEEFGLNVEENDYHPYTFKVDHGRPIPECWDPRAKGNRY